jgi:hypothetical protein
MLAYVLNETIAGCRCYAAVVAALAIILFYVVLFPFFCGCKHSRLQIKNQFFCFLKNSIKKILTSYQGPVAAINYYRNFHA